MKAGIFKNRYKRIKSVLNWIGMRAAYFFSAWMCFSCTFQVNLILDLRTNSNNSRIKNRNNVKMVLGTENGTLKDL